MDNGSENSLPYVLVSIYTAANYTGSLIGISFCFIMADKFK